MTDVYTHPQYLGFINRIRQSPDDDVVRRVCSDWLEEQGEEDRAAFIRCQLAREDYRQYMEAPNE
jgi:uncharacterized protein (TIGR02996 family)